MYLKGDSLIPWSKFMALLLTLSNCENMYYKHSYLSLKNNNIQDQYIQVSNDMRSLLKLISSPTTTTTTTGGVQQPNQQNQQNQTASQIALGYYASSKKSSVDDDPEISFFSSLVQQTCTIVQVRIDMIGVYTTLVMSISQETNFDQLVNSLETIPTIYRDKITHPLLMGIKTNTNYEIQILKNLLKVYVSMNRHIFKDSILLLYQSRLDLDLWRDFDQLNQSRGTYSSDPKWTSNSIHQWLSIFFNALMSKSSLYFHFPLRTVEEENGGTYQSFKDATLRNNPDYVLMIEAFYQKSNSIFFGIFFECKGKPYSKMGYCFNNTEAPTGLGAYPPIFYLPQDKPPNQHLPNIISIYLTNQHALERPHDLFYYVDSQKVETNLKTSSPIAGGGGSGSGTGGGPTHETSDYTYFLVRVEAQIFISVVYKDIKKQKDPIVNDFLKVLVHNLRNTDLFNILRQKESNR
ncbi:hypothetical protein DFA_01080 [Cavenderia fasciculata]|uniref:Uncharacterized protein n=1 Tax=Cavenderia fasciculata TaxID=261658 RepID=F4PQN8_CACFS|nr:uncharacterized protein DFA_01080 [Cavenderia fasciculata]EGG21205.1 hypothetical protein DFA_01080 [Cavenderia fasciculata]|eukprot:XP_004359055.1 hypothetical protein DFA_01080 [Cavenderia fasciculata]